ncbi:hypothetical protein RUM44_011646 [Polyplax serrata]|uniref:Uncharacterized protein n=1 Tax=Polyplax serrata TaxID=468196 RepID=A0ABR1AQL6_POLSC
MLSVDSVGSIAESAIIQKEVGSSSSLSEGRLCHPRKMKSNEALGLNRNLSRNQHHQPSHGEGGRNPPPKTEFVLNEIGLEIGKLRDIDHKLKSTEVTAENGKLNEKPEKEVMRLNGKDRGLKRMER